jgi:hypothetical protein
MQCQIKERRFHKKTHEWIERHKSAEGIQTALYLLVISFQILSLNPSSQVSFTVQPQNHNTGYMTQLCLIKLTSVWLVTSKAQLVSKRNTSREQTTFYQLPVP